MRCSHCGVQLADGTEFCIACHSMQEGVNRPDTPVLQLGTPTPTKVTLGAHAGHKASKPLFSSAAIAILISAFLVVAAMTVRHCVPFREITPSAGGTNSAQARW